MSVKCRTCGREIGTGESAWATDWKVIDVGGESVKNRMETRYQCDECEAAS